MTRPGCQPARQNRKNVLHGLSLLIVGSLAWSAAGQPPAPPPIRDPLAIAARLYAAGRWEEACEVYQEVADQHPVEAALGEARCQRVQGRVDQARARLGKALKDHPQQPRLCLELAELAFWRGDYPRAGQLVETAIQRQPQLPAALWWRAELARVSGKLDEADRDYRRLVELYNRGEVKAAEQLLWIGMGAAQHARWSRSARDFRLLVSELYPEVLKSDPRAWQAKLQIGRLLMEKYNRAAAAEALQAALALNPNAADIHAARAELALQIFDLPAADASLTRALGINPRHRRANLLLADWKVLDLRYTEALRVLTRAQAWYPADEELAGRLAAVYRLIDGDRAEDDTSRAAQLAAAVARRNPRCGTFHVVRGMTLELARRYPPAAAAYRQALQVETRRVDVAGRLGMVLLRLGDESAGGKQLQAAFAADPFNVRVKNSLAVLEVLQDYAVLETEHFVIRFDRGQSSLLARYAARWLEDEVYPDITRRLAYEPPAKTLIEIFTRARNTTGHGWFSARMAGVPAIGTVGACAGKMIAIAAPHEMAQPYSWTRVLRHEFVHVVNLQQTGFTIPHWLTEGLAVWHEDLPRPASWKRVLARRAKLGQLFDLGTLNQGFQRPGSDDWLLAYCQAELYVEFLTKTYGGDAVQQLLAGYKDNLTTEQALRRAVKVEIGVFERQFKHFVDRLVEGWALEYQPPRKELSALRKAAMDDPRNPDVLARLALAHCERGSLITARRLAQQAISFDARHQPSTFVLAKCDLAEKNRTGCLRRLTESFDRDRLHPPSLRLLARLRFEQRRYREAGALYELGRRRFPHDDQWARQLIRVYLRTKDDRGLEAALQQVAAADPDALTIRKKLAQLSLARRDFPAVRKWANQCLGIDVREAEVHATLGAALVRDEQRAERIEHYEVATQLKPDNNAWRFELARALAGAGQKARARAELRKLLERDANHPGARELLESIAP